MSKRINRDELEKFHDYDIHVASRIIYIKDIDEVASERVLKNLTILDQTSSPIVIILNSDGGNWYDGIAIYDAIKACKSHVTVLVRGRAMSMASLILQAADKRIVSKNAKIMIHYGQTSVDDTSNNFIKWADEEVKINKDMEDILLEKMQQKDPSFKRKQLKQMLNPDTIFNAQEAIDIGLADELEGGTVNE